MDFNPQLERLLLEMHARRAPDSAWLFPSAQRGQRDIPAKTLRESFKIVRVAAGGSFEMSGTGAATRLARLHHPRSSMMPPQGFIRCWRAYSFTGGMVGSFKFAEP